MFALFAKYSVRNLKQFMDRKGLRIIKKTEYLPFTVFRLNIYFLHPERQQVLVSFACLTLTNKNLQATPEVYNIYLNCVLKFPQVNLYPQRIKKCPRLNDRKCCQRISINFNSYFYSLLLYYFNSFILK